jgi:hypothetical protein
MTEPIVAAPPPSLISRIIGVITSPRATFEKIVAAVPRPVGVMLVVALVIGVAQAIPQLSENGRQAFLTAQMEAMSRNGPVTPDVAARMETVSHYMPIITVVLSLIFLPVVALFMTVLYWGFFNVILGGTATYKQVLTIVTHSQVIGALAVLAGLPFMLSQPTLKLGGPFNLGALVPMLEETSRLARFLANVSVFSLWGAFVTATGLAVLYRRKLTGILIVVLAIVLLMAGVGVIFTRA